MPRPRSFVSSIPSLATAERTVALLVARHRPGQTAAEVASSLSELRNLVEGLDIAVAGSFVQKRAAGASSEILGTGKQAEVAAELARLRAEAPAPAVLVVVDESLTPGQLRHLTRQLEAEVVDRTDIILRVFAQRARTRTAQLEVELARLTYEAPRVREDETRSHRTGGGGGRGERGHTNVELRKQEIRARVARIERELEGLRPLERHQRERRRELPSVALVGYTNAGKSSLMRGLTGSEVLVADKLFATLGTTVRAVSPATTPRILVADTVGFIKNLPHELVTSFRATLDEARDADLLLVVTDASDSRWDEQLRVTRETLAALGPELPPTLLVFNKIDRVPEADRARFSEAFPDAVLMNALDPSELQRLRRQLVETFDRQMAEEVLSIPVADGRLLASVRAHAHVLEERLDEAGESLLLRVRAMPASLERWRVHTKALSTVAGS